MSNSLEKTKNRQLKPLWRETRIGDVLPWEDVADEAQRLLDIHNASRYAPCEDHEDGERANDQEVDQGRSGCNRPLQRSHLRAKKT